MFLNQVSNDQRRDSVCLTVCTLQLLSKALKCPILRRAMPTTPLVAELLAAHTFAA